MEASVLTETWIAFSKSTRQLALSVAQDFIWIQLQTLALQILFTSKIASISLSMGKHVFSAITYFTFNHQLRKSAQMVVIMRALIKLQYLGRFAA